MCAMRDRNALCDGEVAVPGEQMRYGRLGVGKGGKGEAGSCAVQLMCESRILVLICAVMLAGLQGRAERRV